MAAPPYTPTQEINWVDLWHPHFLEEIEQKYAIVKKSSRFPEESFCYCIAKSDLATLARRYVTSSANCIRAARDKVVMITFPTSAVMQDQGRFHQAEQIYAALNNTRGILTPLCSHLSNPFAYRVYPWPHGCSLQTYLQAVKERRAILSKGFVWHVTASLLEIVIQLRQGWPKLRGKPVKHTDINLQNVMITPESAFALYPSVKLAFFESGELGPRTVQNEAEQEFGENIHEDVRSIGLILHRLAHDKYHLRLIDPDWHIKCLSTDGHCTCIERAPSRRSIFGSTDTRFLEILRRLVRISNMLYGEQDLKEILNMVKQCRIEALPTESTSLLSGFNPKEWDISQEVIPDSSLKELIDNARSPAQP